MVKNTSLWIGLALVGVAVVSLFLLGDATQEPELAQEFSLRSSYRL